MPRLPELAHPAAIAAAAITMTTLEVLVNVSGHIRRPWDRSRELAAEVAVGAALELLVPALAVPTPAGAPAVLLSAVPPVVLPRSGSMFAGVGPE